MPTSMPTKPNLYALTLEAQEVDGELAIALDKASSSDPEEQVEAETLITGLLERASTNQALLRQKANAICHIHEALLGKAEYLRKSAAERLEKAKAEERAAERLLDYLTRCLTALNPGQTSFSLPEYTIKARTSQAVEVEAEGDLSKDLCRYDLTIRLASGAGAGETVDQLLAVATETMRDLFELDPSQYEIKLESAPDKAAIKAAIKAAAQDGGTISGAQIVTRVNWKIQ